MSEAGAVGKKRRINEKKERGKDKKEQQRKKKVEKGSEDHFIWHLQLQYEG